MARESEKPPYVELEMRFISQEFPKDASIEQRVAEMKQLGAGERQRDELCEREFGALKIMEENARNEPPENYQPMSEAAKAAIIADMAGHEDEFAKDLALCRLRSRDLPAGVTFADVRAALERQEARARRDVTAPVYDYWPQNGQNCPRTWPFGTVDERQLVPVPADCLDIPAHLARVRWSPGRPVKWV